MDDMNMRESMDKSSPSPTLLYTTTSFTGTFAY